MPTELRDCAEDSKILERASDLNADKGICSAQCDRRPAQEQLCVGRPGGHGIEGR